MIAPIASAGPHPNDSSVLVVRPVNGPDMQYYNNNGHMILGQLWYGSCKEGEVRFFLPFAGDPIVLGIRAQEGRLIPEDSVANIVNAIEDMGNDAPEALRGLWKQLIAR